MTHALKVRGLRKVYGDGHEALKGVDLDVEQGEFFALLGPNGAGKSTLIGIVAGLVNRSSGDARIFGFDTLSDPTGARMNLGIVPQEFNFNMFESPLEIACNQGGYYGLPRELAAERAERYLRQLGLWEKRSTPSRGLSGGMKRRLMIARALVHQPRLLILDEPTAGVDIELRRSMWQFLREINAGGTTIILTTHYLEEAESLCDAIAIIDQGNIVEDTDMKSLLGKLRVETFVLDLNAPLAVAPRMAGFECRLVGQTTLEVDVEDTASLNEMFAQLDRAGVNVASMRNKSNRLEELFLRLTGNARDEEAAT